MAAKDDLGRAGEERAAEYLRAQGDDILDCNWRCPLGEIDIVARSGPVICIVEVKTRSGLGFGHPFEAVDERKRRRLWRLAAAWAVAHPDEARGRELRIDILAIVGPEPASGTIEHLRDLR